MGIHQNIVLIVIEFIGCVKGDENTQFIKIKIKNNQNNSLKTNP